VTSQAPASPPLEQSLVERIRLGDAGAFDALFRSFYGQLCTFAFRYVRSNEDAEDVVQDVFAAIWQRRSAWNVEGNVRAYLFGAVRNRALRRSEQLARHEKRSVLSFDVVLEAGGAPVDRQIEDEEVEANVRAAMATLPDRSREVVVLRWQHQMTYPEIARTMGISVKGVENQLARATKKLRERLTWLREVRVS
jgi:RNA polymerase sigma-70 factor, ECF subfamily